jgi:hypothetical protein
MDYIVTFTVTMESTTMGVQRISFADYESNGSIRNGWRPVSDGADPDEGQNRADELIRYVSRTNNVPVFARVVRDAIASEVASRSMFVTGFLFQIAEHMKIAADAMKALLK